MMTRGASREANRAIIPPIIFRFIVPRACPKFIASDHLVHLVFGLAACIVQHMIVCSAAVAVEQPPSCQLGGTL